MAAIEQLSISALDDDAIYRRTARGQRELVGARLLRSTTQERVLARVNGYTDLRRLLELSPEPSVDVGAAILALRDRGLIEQVSPVRLPGLPPHALWARAEAT